ncbi:MAG: DNA-binding response regulator, partial [Rhizobiaceae bacterium]|nr:DNA-binding response regulator [Rhizobiaceae bacterium]
MDSNDRTEPSTPPDDDAPHLLVVDDDTRIRNLLKQYLSENGFRVTVAGSAAEARRQLAGLDFDLLVIDVMMPGENGVDLTRSLRDQKNVPILMLTALSETDSRVAGLEAGADDYLPKPFDPRELILRINNILRRGGPVATPKVEQLVFGPYTFQIARRELKRGGQPLKLT